jgi:hypothetical protein
MAARPRRSDRERIVHGARLDTHPWLHTTQALTTPSTRRRSQPPATTASQPSNRSRTTVDPMRGGVQESDRVAGAGHRQSRIPHFITADALSLSTTSGARSLLPTRKRDDTGGRAQCTTGSNLDCLPRLEPVEPPRGIEPRTCSLRGGRTTTTTVSTSDNSCSPHTFRCLSRHHATPVRTTFDSTPARQ